MPALTVSEGVAGERTAAPDQSATYAEGITAGLVGAATIAVWFFILDVFQGRPLYTPTVLGRILLFGGLQPGETVMPDFEPAFAFTWVHILVFLVIGVLVSRLLALAEREPNWGFGVVLLAVIFTYGFVGVCMVFAAPVLHALTWPAILVGNLLAAAAMAVTFRRRHPRMEIAP